MVKQIGAWIHAFAPHSAEALYLCSGMSAVLAMAVVYGRCRHFGSHHHLPLGWYVAVASIAAPVPTWVLLIVMPLDHDLSQAVLNDPVVVALAGLYGLGAAIKEARGIMSDAWRRMKAGEATVSGHVSKER